MKEEKVKEIESLIYTKSPDALMNLWRGDLYQDLDWGTIVSILKNADTAGMTDIWARLAQRMYQDGRIVALRTTRISPISGAKFNSTPGGPRDIDKLAAADAAIMLSSIPNFPMIMDHLLDGIFLGYSVAEIIWERRGDWIWPVRIDLIAPDRIRFDDKFEPYLYDNGALSNDPGANPMIRRMGRPLTKNKYIVHMPRALPTYPNAAGLLRACIRYWWAKWQGAKYWLNGAESSGNPRIIGKYPTEASATARREFYDALEAMSATSTIAMSKDNEVQVVAPSAQGNGSVWSGIQDWADKGMTLTVLGSDLLTNSGINGSRALGEAQGEYTIDPRLINDSTSIWSTLTEQLIKPFLEFNNFRYSFSIPTLPKMESVFVELTPNVDQALIDSKACTINELRASRGLEKWPDSIGNKIIGTIIDPIPDPTEQIK